MLSTRESFSCCYETAFTEISKARQPSAIRALTPLANQPGMLSLAGGMPNPRSFPFAGVSMEIRAPGVAANDGTTTEKSTKVELSEGDLKMALQYSGTNGLQPLVKWLEELQRQEHAPPKKALEKLSLAVTGGSQDGLTKAFEMLSGPGVPILVEEPTYRTDRLTPPQMHRCRDVAYLSVVMEQLEQDGPF